MEEANNMTELTLFHYLFAGLILFVIGIAGSILCKNIIKVLISIEFILTGVNINFTAFARYCDNLNYDGFTMALFYTGIGAVELAVGIYIFYLMYNKKRTENIEQYGDL